MLVAGVVLVIAAATMVAIELGLLVAGLALIAAAIDLTTRTGRKDAT